MKAIVTGGAGFIGSNLVDRLLTEGCEVHVIDDLSTGSLDNLNQARAYGHRFSFTEIDIRASEVIDCVVSFSPDVIFHLAAQASVSVSCKLPYFDADVNILGTIRMLDAARAAGVSKFVAAASGGTLYGDADPQLLPFNETVPHVPSSPYGVSKKVLLDYLPVYHSLFGLDYCVLALANVYGPRQDPNGEAGVVAIFAANATFDRPSTIFGDGEQTRDFVFVEDVATAFLCAIDRASLKIINIGTGTETSVNRIHDLIVTERHVSSEVIHLPAREGDIRRNALDPTAAIRHLGWRPITSIETGIHRVIESMTLQLS